MQRKTGNHDDDAVSTAGSCFESNSAEVDAASAPVPRSFLAILSHTKSQNVNCNRMLHVDTSSDQNISWCDYLEKVTALYPGIIQIPYVCDASFDNVSIQNVESTIIFSFKCIMFINIGVGISQRRPVNSVPDN